MTCIDLNLDQPIISDSSGIGGESVYVHRKIGILAIDGFSSVATLRHLRSAVSRRPENQIVPVLRALARDGFRAADLSGKPTRHRNVPACRGDEAVSHGHSQQRLAKQSVERQSNTRLANLRRLRPDPDRPSTGGLRGRRLGHRPGRIDNRPAVFTAKPRVKCSIWNY